MAAYYNENEPYCAQWLRNLIAAGLIAPGDVDDRSIGDVSAGDLQGYTQCHFFAGLGGWSRALRLAGWSDDRAVWTGSCPCQPFSAAGKQKGFEDERHLWPVWFRLIAERRPAVVFGEQVAGAVGKGWLDAVACDLEGEGYAIGAAILPACGVGAPHKRNRLWFVADAGRQHVERRSGERGSAPTGGACDWAARPSEHAIDVADTAQSDGGLGTPKPHQRQEPEFRESGFADALADPDEQQTERPAKPRDECGWWRVEPDVGRVAHGVRKRVAKLRALGNAIVPQCAAAFIRAYDLT